LKRKSTEFGYHFEPLQAYLDFEIGTILALEKTVKCFWIFSHILFAYF